LGLAGCGGGDSKTISGTEASTTPAPTVATTPAPVPTTATTPAPTSPSPTTTTPGKPPSSDEPPPNSGGTEPARTELEFRGTKSGIKPRHAGVAPYISVKVTLTSEDHSAHSLTINGQTAKVGGTRTSAFFTLPGLPPGKTYKGVADGSTQVTIASTSEPGP
jgi:hypothetical protein